MNWLKRLIGKAGRGFGAASLLDDIPREQQVLILTMGALEHLIDLGMITGPKLMTPKGQQILAELKASGFKPTPEETQWAMNALLTSKSSNK